MPRRQRSEMWKIRKAARKAAAKNRSKHLSEVASRATLEAKSEAISSPACHFLRIPLEIRHQIYGYLLLDPPRASLQPLDTQEWEDIDRDDSAHDSYDYGGSDFDAQMLALSDFNPYGMEMEDMSDGIFNEMYTGGGNTGLGYGMFGDFGDFDDQSDTMNFGSPSLPFPFPIDDGEESDNEGGRGTRFLGKSLPTKVNDKDEMINDKDEMEIQRHLAILRTNRQIYNEASALLHSGLTIIVEPGDALTDTPGNAIVERSEKLWRHAPSNTLPSAKINGQTVYNTPSLDGVLEPHVFAQFRKISYIGLFDFTVDDDAPSFHINDDLRACAEDERMFVSYLTATKNVTRLRRNPLPAVRADKSPRPRLRDILYSEEVVTQPSVADIIQKFVDLLSNSPVIHHLEFVLNVCVNCSNIFETVDYDSEDSEQEAKEDEKCDIANARAAELVLEAGVLDPLRNLSNVMSFSCRMETFDNDGEVMKPKKKHLKMIQDLKKAIESNWIWVVKHGSH